MKKLILAGCAIACCTIHSFNLQAYNQEIHDQIKQLPDSIVKNIQWQYLDSFICHDNKNDAQLLRQNRIQGRDDHFQDTIYIMQQIGELGNFDIMLWDKQKSLSYSYETGMIKISNSLTI